MSESGALEFYIFPSQSPRLGAYKQFLLTGQMPMPPMFALGYHQCRWNYMTQEETIDISTQMTKHKIPCDAIWLDIEHTEEKKYFTWDMKTFPEAKKMLGQLVADGRKLVTIVDPHVKKDDDYFLYKEIRDKKLFIMDDSGESPYVGWCWPKTSVWVDFMNEEARKLFGSVYDPERQKLLDDGQQHENFIFSDPNVHIWNDMNEPACFDPYEKSMPKSNLHSMNGKLVEHRDVHNLYGFYNTMATYEGLLSRTKGNERPFILTRSFFAGSQKYSAMWSGDCRCDYVHFNLGVPILLQSSICGLTFIGTDVPGFFNDPPSDEFVVRAYQVGSLMPFFRAHSHPDAKKREPWTFSEEICNRIRDAVTLRYRLLPYIYSAFYQSHLSGEPIMRPMWYQYPQSKGANQEENQFMLGESILVCPVVDEGAIKQKIYAPEETSWYDMFTMKLLNPIDSFIEIDISLKNFGLLAGSIIPTYAFGDEYVRSTEDLKECKYDLNVYINPENNCASGFLYIDDGKTFGYKEKKAYTLITIECQQIGQLSFNIKHDGLGIVAQGVPLEEQPFINKIIVNKGIETQILDQASLEFD